MQRLWTINFIGQAKCFSIVLNRFLFFMTVKMLTGFFMQFPDAFRDFKILALEFNSFLEFLSSE